MLIFIPYQKKEAGSEGLIIVTGSFLCVSAVQESVKRNVKPPKIVFGNYYSHHSWRYLWFITESSVLLVL